MAGEFPRRSRFGGPKRVPPRVPRAPRQLTERRQKRRAGGQGRPRRGSCTRPARAHAGRPRPASLRAPGDWRLDDEAEQGWEVIGRNPQPLNKPGRGGASSGRDTTARLFESR